MKRIKKLNMGDIMALTDTQYDEIMRTYYENQFKNRSLLQERKEEIYPAIPRIAEIDEMHRAVWVGDDQVVVIDRRHHQRFPETVSRIEQFDDHLPAVGVDQADVGIPLAQNADAAVVVSDG